MILSSPPFADFLAGGGETGALIRSKDWSQTPLGPIDSWPQSLKISLRIVLSSRYPMFIWWGEELSLLYNDAYAQMTLASKHPWALGRPGHEVWSEIWSEIHPRIKEVIQKGQATWDEELLLILERQGFPEETYHTFSYSPIPDDHDGIGGIICPVTEETKQVISRRRLKTLRELAARTTEESRSAENAARAAIEILAENPYDISFALIYLLDAEGKGARLAGATGLPADSPARPQTIDLSAAESAGWPLAPALASPPTDLVSALRERFGPLPGGVWPESPEQAIVLPIKPSAQSSVAGLLVVGLSPRLLFDDEYRGFLELTAGHIGTAIANAQAYQAERQRAEALAELDLAKTTFFNNISHEFRTPLTLMLAPIEESLAQAHDAGERERLELLQRNALRLQKLVNTLLDYSRLEAGRIHAVYEPVDLARLTIDLTSLFRSAVEKAGLRLLVNCAPLPEPVYVDRDKWEQIILNLLSNAFKFTWAGEIEVSLRDAGSAVQLRVRDTGCGISHDQLPRLFERFHRVEGASARTQEGAGIGLAFVSELVKLHGGRVDVESVLGEGSTFIVTLPKGKEHLPPDQLITRRSLNRPASQASSYVEEALRWLPDSTPEPAKQFSPRLPEQPADVVPAELNSAHSGMRIVLADDNADMRDYMRRMLVANYEVEAVADGLAALEALRRKPADLLISDVMMPKLDGFGLLHTIRTDEQLMTLPVIMLSARAGEEAKVEGLDAGADDYLVKPFGARELLARVSAQLELARVRREATVALRASEARYRALAHASTNSLHRLSADGLEFLEVIMGNSLQEVYGTTPTLALLQEGLHPDEVKQIYKTWMDAVEAQVPYEMEHRVRQPDGSWGWIHSRTVPVRNEANQVVEWIGSATDITARKRAEEELRQAEERLRLAVEAGNIFTWEVDVATRRVTYSANVKEVMGFGLQPVTTADRDLVHPEDRAFVLEHFSGVIRGEHEYDIEHRFVNPESGEVVWVRAQGVLVWDSGGNRPRLVGVTQNITERKQVEESLRHSEERYRLLFEAMNDGLLVGEVICNEAGEPINYYFREVNAALERILKHKREEMIGQTALDLFPNLNQELMKIAGRVAITGQPETIEGYSPVLGWWYRSNVYSPQPGQFAVIFVDMSERKRAEEELRNSEERLRLAIEAGNIFTWEVEPESGKVTYSANVKDVLGFSLHEAAYAGRQLVHADDLAVITPRYEQALRGETDYNIEYRFVNPTTAEVVWVRVQGVLVASVEGKPGRFLGVTQNITAHKHAEEELRRLNETLERRVQERTQQVRESEARFRALVDASAQIVWTMDAQGQVDEDSASWRAFTGQSFAQGKGWGWMQAIHPDDRDHAVTSWRRAVAKQASLNTEFRIHHVSGEWRWMQVRAVPLHNEQGEVSGWVGMNIDIHERKQAEADRERLARSLLMAEQEERRRLSQILHDDLQQLLYATQMRISLIGQDLATMGQQALVDEIEEAGQWLKQCIDTTRQLTVDLSPPILKNEGLADALEWLQPQMERLYGLTIVINAEHNFRVADADLRALLFQVVRELLFNVAKHAGVNRVVVTLEQEDTRLVIHVMDGGRGFELAEIGERQQQKGGFGLFSVQERLRLVGGRLEVRTKVGAGTHVIVHAPVAVAHRAAG